MTGSVSYTHLPLFSLLSSFLQSRAVITSIVLKRKIYTKMRNNFPSDSYRWRGRRVTEWIKEWGFWQSQDPVWQCFLWFLWNIKHCHTGSCDCQKPHSFIHSVTLLPLHLYESDGKLFRIFVYIFLLRTILVITALLCRKDDSNENKGCRSRTGFQKAAASGRCV